MEDKCSKIKEALEAMDLQGEIKEYNRYGNGHINDTFLVVCEKDGATIRYILQRMNHDIFKDPVALMDNILAITKFVRERIIEHNGNPDRETMNVVMTKDGKPFFKDSQGCYWRTYLFVEDTVCFDKVETPEDFYESAVAFGNFQKQLSAFDASVLTETIKDFHNTPVRFETFKKAVEEDVCGRAASVAEEIKFVTDRQEEMKIVANMQAKGELPLRVTHNDTKLNNILMDKQSKKGICVIDLDTVMPGMAINDFGDSIRFGANTAAEDEVDLEKVSLSLDLFETYARGFLDGCDGSLTSQEISMLPMGAKMMTLECGMRFLTDYLQGDTYFKIHRDNHNLDRARCQFALVADMEKKWTRMKEIVEKYK